jgi:hypothetical protein
MGIRIEKIEQNVNVNNNKIDNVKKIYITLNSENFMKKIIEIPILINQEVSATESGGGGGVGG